MRPLKSSFPKLPFRDGLCGWCLLVGGCQLFRAWVLIKGIKERKKDKEPYSGTPSLVDGCLFFQIFIGGGRGAGRNFVAKTWCQTPSFHPQTVPYFIYLFIYVFSHTLHCRFIQVLYMLIFGSKLYSLAFVHVYLPACRRLLFPLLHAERRRR